MNCSNRQEGRLLLCKIPAWTQKAVNLKEAEWRRIKKIREVVSLWKYTTNPIDDFLINKDKTRTDLRYIYHKKLQPFRDEVDGILWDIFSSPR